MQSRDSSEHKEKMGTSVGAKLAAHVLGRFGLLLCGVLCCSLSLSNAAGQTPNSSTAQADEALIREYEALERQSATAATYDQFIAAHPKLLTVAVRPYGSPLLWALEHEKPEPVLALVRAGATITPEALTLAARGGIDVLVKLFLERGIRDDAEGSALRAAANYDHASTLRLLIAHGANLDAQAKNDGFTALHVAIQDRRLAALRVLIAAKAPLEARDHRGRTALSWGPFAYRPLEKHIYQKLGRPHDTVYVDPGVATGIQVLLDAGAKIDTVDNEGNTPLHEAARMGSLRGAQILVARGAKPTVKNRAGETPLSLARERTNQELIELLLGKKRGP